MGNSETGLAALIGSRICHDLISPIGAINNGLELLQMSGGPDGPEMDLIGESVGSASARIRFFRIAFGAAGDQMVGAAEAAAILRDFYGTARHEVHWHCAEPRTRMEVRLAFLALLCLEEALPYGGRIDVELSDDTWHLDARGDRLVIQDRLWDLLDNPQPFDPGQLEPAHVQFALLPVIAAEAERRIIRRMQGESLSLSF